MLILRTLKNLSSNFLLWIRIRIGSGFKNFVDTDQSGSTTLPQCFFIVSLDVGQFFIGTGTGMPLQ
jgi:hypothetical protein